MPLLTALPLLFPDGRLPSRRWWPAAVLCVLMLGCADVGLRLRAGAAGRLPARREPARCGGRGGRRRRGRAPGRVPAVRADRHRLRRRAREPLPPLTRASSGSSSSGSRPPPGSSWRRGSPTWRSTSAFEVETESLLLAPTLLAVPAAATVAILRYRLYDLGRIVNRTLVYAALTADAGRRLPRPRCCWSSSPSGESDAAVAVSTLAVAALFRPARARIQARRRPPLLPPPLRRRAHAGGVRRASARRARPRRRSRRELRGAVADTVQPAHVSLWLRR